MAPVIIRTLAEGAFSVFQKDSYTPDSDRPCLRMEVVPQSSNKEPQLVILSLLLVAALSSISDSNTARTCFLDHLGSPELEPSLGNFEISCTVSGPVNPSVVIIIIVWPDY